MDWKKFCVWNGSSKSRSSRPANASEIVSFGKRGVLRSWRSPRTSWITSLATNCHKVYSCVIFFVHFLVFIDMESNFSLQWIFRINQGQLCSKFLDKMAKNRFVGHFWHLNYFLVDFDPSLPTIFFLSKKLSVNKKAERPTNLQTNFDF